MESINQAEYVNYFLKQGVLVNPDFFQIDFTGNLENLHKSIASESNFLFLSKDTLLLLEKSIDWFSCDSHKALHEKGLSSEYLDFFHEKNHNLSFAPVKIVSSYKEESKKRGLKDFVSLFNARFTTLERYLRNRVELSNCLSINRIINKREKESVTFIGMVKTKTTTKNGNIILEVEDPSGEIKVLISKKNKELLNFAEEITLDEVIGVVGMNAENIVFANTILNPDIPLGKELKKSPDESYAIFISDIHIGSDKFLSKEFNQFIQWINCKIGNEKQKNVAKKVKYLFIVGDLIDGLGIYPGQDEELDIKDIQGQYDECARYLSQVPSHIQIIICPGNHDALRIAEPQPVLYKDFAASLWKFPNITMVSNPSVVNIHSSEDFPGFDVLLYHGYSFDWYMANISSIRNNGGYDRADLLMRYLLQKRHLAPTHKSTLYIPEVSCDPLIIKTIPDFFATGHVHNTPIVSNYRGVTTLSCGCWQAKTPFQEKVGHNPGPGKVPIINLQSREVKILKFIND